MKKETVATVSSLPIAAMLLTGAGLGSIAVAAFSVRPLVNSNSCALNTNDQMSCQDPQTPCSWWSIWGNGTGNCETVADGCNCE